MCKCRTKKQSDMHMIRFLLKSNADLHFFVVIHFISFISFHFERIEIKFRMKLKRQMRVISIGFDLIQRFFREINSKIAVLTSTNSWLTLSCYCQL